MSVRPLVSGYARWASSYRVPPSGVVHQFVHHLCAGVSKEPNVMVKTIFSLFFTSVFDYCFGSIFKFPDFLLCVRDLRNLA